MILSRGIMETCMEQWVQGASYAWLWYDTQNIASTYNFYYKATIYNLIFMVETLEGCRVMCVRLTRYLLMIYTPTSLGKLNRKSLEVVQQPLRLNDLV
jgi:hypothetical protein